MTAHRGIPATEQAELLGRLSRADGARQELRRTAAPVVSQVGDGAWRDWLKQRALRAARRAGRAAAGPALGTLGVAALLALAVTRARRGRRRPARRR